MKTFTLSIIFITQNLCISAQVSDWNNGGGNPKRNGVSFVNGPETDSLLWQDNPAGLFGMPCYIEGDKLVTMRFLSMTNAPVVCYDLTTGELQWQKEITGMTGRSLPVGVRDGQVYVVSYKETQHDTLYALGMKDGNKVWTCDVTVNPYITASVSFTENGDLVIERSTGISRIDHQTGQQMWNCPVIGFAGGCMEVAVNHSNNTGYCIEQIGGVAYVAAIDLASGVKKYNHVLTDTHPGGGIQQAPIIVGNNGVIYAHKQGDNITALSDDGTSLSLLWETPISGNAPFAHICTGADGSVYAPSGDKIIRIDPADGEIINSSMVFCANPELFQLRLSSTQNNLIFATNGENKLSVFDLELNLLWSVNIPNVNTSGAAIGSNGVIAVSGTNVIKVYTPGVNVGIKDEPGRQELLVYPVPFTRNFNIIADPVLTGSEFRVYDLSGKLVKHGILTSDNTYVTAEDLAEGNYYLVCRESGKQIIKSAKH